ncbi:MAG TPA: diguanylate cyclase [Gemmatimonadaceae bacterium]|nr:diguanylate cyclase [Gemmatimonadaceae bacterium]
MRIPADDGSPDPLQQTCDRVTDSAPPRPRPLRLTAPRMDSIRNRVLAFAVLATLVPSGITMGISYARSQRALEDKISEDLHSASTQTARAMSVWVRERLYDLRVFAASDEVAKNLDRSGGAAGIAINRQRLQDYLLSLHERFGDFEQLMVLDVHGQVVGTSAHAASPVRLPHGWLRLLRTQGQLVGAPTWNQKTGRGKLIVAVPIQRAGGRITGAFAAEVNLGPMRGLLREFAHDSSAAIHLLSTSGAMIASTDSLSVALLDAKLPAGTLDRLTARDNAVLRFTGLAGRDVVGAAEPVPQVPWLVLAEISTDAAFGQARRSRDISLMVMMLLLIGVAASGYRFGLLVARPLDRLTQAAAEVAAGDLAVDLPDGGSGEVGALTSVFNHMVSRLRDGRRELDETNETLRAKNEELERLSITDGLTGLANHRFLMQRLQEEGVRSNRYNREFSVLMADVDEFKDYNDTFGHPAGDEVLKKVAAILRDSTRTIDCAARYGGEEFAIVLPETAVAGAMEVAERIRARVAAETFWGRQITLSIGVAEFPKDGDTPRAVIAIADKALYQAKRDGRDRVAQARKVARAKR